MPKLIKIPQKLADLLAEPERVRDALILLNGLASLELKIVPPAANFGRGAGAVGLVGENSALTLPLPIQFPDGWVRPTGTFTRSTFVTSTVTTAQLAERVAALIADLQSVKIAPGG